MGKKQVRYDAQEFKLFMVKEDEAQLVYPNEHMRVLGEEYFYPQTAESMVSVNFGNTP